MNDSVIVRIPRALFERILSDLRRPHPFAAERVGFLFTRAGSGPPGTMLLFPVEYLAVPDDQYLEDSDPWIGAAINGDAIRSAMQHVMETHLGALHVHLHDFAGRPHFSPTDWRDIPDLARSFQHADPNRIHGALVLSPDAAAGAVWLPNQPMSQPLQPHIAIVGYPLHKFEGEGYHDDGTLQ